MFIKKQQGNPIAVNRKGKGLVESKPLDSKEIYSCAERLYNSELDEHPLAVTASIMG